MKKIILSLSIAATMVACNSNKPAETSTPLLLPSETSLQQNALTDTAPLQRPVAIEEPKAAPQPQRIIERTTVIYRDAPRKTKKPVLQSEPETEAPVATSSNTPAAPAQSGAETGATGDAGTETTSNKKEGISKAAKGAIIGGVGGAVAGAVIGKNAKGAVIGGVIGAAGGYILGRKKDKKDGRIELSN